MQTLRFFALRRNYRRKRHAPFFFLTFLPSDGRLVAKSCSLFVAACIHAPYRRRVRWYDSTRAVSRAVARKISSRVASLYFYIFSLARSRAQLCDRSDLGRAVFFSLPFHVGSLRIPCSVAVRVCRTGCALVRSCWDCSVAFHIGRSGLARQIAVTVFSGSMFEGLQRLATRPW